MLYSMVVLIPCALQTLVTLRSLSVHHGMFYVLIAVLAAWVADVSAFFAGTFFGKHKLCPEISPKKTVGSAQSAGWWSMWLLSCCAVFFFSQVFLRRGEAGKLSFAVSHRVFGTFVSMLGDLSFSLIKRSCHIKDFGQVIPGHGGILDRFDSVIFTAPFCLSSGRISADCRVMLAVVHIVDQICGLTAFWAFVAFKGGS